MHINELLSGRSENRVVDFKDAVSWKDKAFRVKVVKAALAFANTPDGGWLVIGVKDDTAEVVGLSPDDLASYDTTQVNNFINEHADPPINATLTKESVEGKWVVAIRIPPFPLTPHLCKKDASDLTKGTIYIRDANNSCSPVKETHQLREILDRAVRLNSDYMLAQIRGIMAAPLTSQRLPADFEWTELVESATKRGSEVFATEGIPETAPVFRSIAHPETPLQKQLDLEELRNRCLKASVNRTGWPYLYVDPKSEFTYNLNSSLETAIRHGSFGPYPRFDFWNFAQNGLFIQQIVYASGFNPGPPRVTVTDLWYYIALALDSIVRLFEGILLPEDLLVVRLDFSNLENSRLCSNLDRPEVPDRILSLNLVCREPLVSFELRRPFADLKAGLVAHIIEATESVARRFNWSHGRLVSERDVGGLLEKDYP